MPYKSSNIPRARSLRKNMTPWERKLWYCFLSTYPVRFQRQKAIDHYIIDFYCAGAKLAVELDGSGHYNEEQAQKDESRTRILQTYGINVIRFCNLDIDRDFNGVCSAIDIAVKEHWRR